MKTVGDLCRVAIEGILTTDRDGPYGCGAVFFTNERLAEMDMLSETITLVTETEDPEAWKLMRAAVAEIRGDQDSLEIVALGCEPRHPNDVQVIYGACLRDEGVS